MGQAPADIRRQIAATRARMSETIEAITDRLDPREQASYALSQWRKWGRGLFDITCEAVNEAPAQRKRQAQGKGALI
jgi:Protein of unknown function (DUF3618)